MHRIPNLCFSLRINAMKPYFPAFYGFKRENFSKFYVTSCILIGNYIPNFQFTHICIVLIVFPISGKRLGY